MKIVFWGLVLFAPFFLEWFVRKFLNKKLSAISLAFISSLVFYCFVLLIVLVIDWQLKSDLMRYDLNGDGYFSGEELIPEQEKARKRYVSDTSRRLIPFTGVIVAFFYFSVVFFVWKVKEFMCKYLKQKQEQG